MAAPVPARPGPALRGGRAPCPSPRRAAVTSQGAQRASSRRGAGRARRGNLNKTYGLRRIPPSSWIFCTSLWWFNLAGSQTPPSRSLAPPPPWWDRERIGRTILHPLCVKYPPSTKYRRCFLTELIKKHESAAAEPLDELYDALADILNEKESTHCYKSYLLPTGESVTLSESVAIISGGTTGLVTWDAALHLAEWATENSTVFSNRTVLELGSGIGFTGIAICKTCNPKTYVFSDYHPCVLKQLTENIRLNGFVLEPETTPHIQTEPQGQEAEATNCQKPKLTVAELDWGSVTEKQLLDLQPDVIVAAGALHF
ncbi:protein-lysine N-methyltransferase EEF2KMT isoform X3 [Calonectris borealis]|uniref:protein-lysine N-methyltransferase EEF2KMT isoform X3 n=1 Tax=Calonectris borealis TaxID=1323832 RepID=UPI003F4BEBC8